MKFVLQKCRKTFYWAIFFAGITFMGIPTANALFIGGFNLGLLCGPVHTWPVPVPVGNGYRFISASATATVLKAGTADRKILRHFLVVKSVLPNGTADWSRNLTVQSLPIAEVFPDDIPPSYSLPDVLDTGDRVSPALFLASECLSLSVANHNNQSYVAVAAGTSSSTGGPLPTAVVNQQLNADGKGSNKTLAVIKGQDKTVLNISILNINNGKPVRTFRPRPKPGRFLLLSTSGIFDIDNDFNDELVLAYIRFIGETRHDFIFEHYNIVTGALERTTTTTQQNLIKFQ